MCQLNNEVLSKGFGLEFVNLTPDSLPQVLTLIKALISKAYIPKG
jgi:hypothetical protein